jgi:hypothetical protein
MLHFLDRDRSPEQKRMAREGRKAPVTSSPVEAVSTNRILGEQQESLQGEADQAAARQHESFEPHSADPNAAQSLSEQHDADRAAKLRSRGFIDIAGQLRHVEELRPVSKSDEDNVSEAAMAVAEVEAETLPEHLTRDERERIMFSKLDEWRTPAQKAAAAKHTRFMKERDEEYESDKYLQIKDPSNQETKDDQPRQQELGFPSPIQPTPDPEFDVADTLRNRDTALSKAVESTPDAPTPSDVSKAKAKLTEKNKPSRRRRNRGKHGESGQARLPDIEPLIILAKDVVNKGAKTLADFSSGMRSHLGSTWDHFKGSAKRLFDVVRRKKPEGPVHEGPYAGVAKLSKKKSPVHSSVLPALKALSGKAGRLFVPLASQAEHIDGPAGGAIRQYDFDLSNAISKDFKRVKGFVEAMHKLRKMSEIELGVFKMAVLNGDFDKADSMADDHGFRPEWETAKKVFDDLLIKFNKSGLRVRNIENYFKREIIDLKGLQEAVGTIDKHKAEEYKLLGENVSSLSNSATQDRLIDVVRPEWLEYYADPDAAIMNYIRQAHRTIESRKFLIKSAKDQTLSPETLVGMKLDSLLGDRKNKMSETDLMNLSLIYQSAFKNKGITNQAMRIYRNVFLIDALGSVSTAVTQLGDWATAFAIYGPRAGIPAVGTALGNVGRRARGKKTKGLTQGDVGVDEIAHELLVKSPVRRRGAGDLMERQTAKMFDFVVKASGMSMADKMGKEVLLNAAHRKLSREARSGKLSGRSKRLLDVLFDKDQDRKDAVIANLKKGGELTDDARLFFFHELTKVQPVSLSAVPAAYHTSGNARIFYALKTFQLSHMNALRDELFDRNVPLKERAMTAMRVGTLLSFGMMGVSEIKDWMFNRETPLPEQWWNAMFNILGFQKFFLYKARNEGKLMTAGKFIAPIPPSVGRAWRDYDKWTAEGVKVDNPDLIKDLELWHSVPLAGKFWHGHAGAGAKRTEKRRRSPDHKATLRDQLAGQDMALYEPRFNWLGHDMNPEVYWDAVNEGYDIVTGDRPTRDLGKAAQKAFGDQVFGYGGKPPSTVFKVNDREYEMYPHEYQKYLEISGTLTRRAMKRESIKWARGKRSEAQENRKRIIVREARRITRELMFPGLYPNAPKGPRLYAPEN